MTACVGGGTLGAETVMGMVGKLQQRDPSWAFTAA